MGIEVPRLPLQPGETITMEQLFKHVGSTLFQQGQVPQEFTTDEWAQAQAQLYLEEVVDDKEK